MDLGEGNHMSSYCEHFVFCFGRMCVWQGAWRMTDLIKRIGIFFLDCEQPNSIHCKEKEKTNKQKKQPNNYLGRLNCGKQI